MELFYVGNAHYTRERFRDGHKAFLWSWLDHYNSEDVRLLLHPLDFIQLQTLSPSLARLYPLSSIAKQVRPSVEEVTGNFNRVWFHSRHLRSPYLPKLLSHQR